jgi:hypothetical protein
VTWLMPKWPTGRVCRPVAGSPASRAWSSDEGSLKVLLVRPSPVRSVHVEMVLMAHAQPNGETRSVAGRTGTLGLRVVLLELYAPR